MDEPTEKAMRREYKEVEGMVNAYTCLGGHTTVTVVRDDGVTPFMISCRIDGCEYMAKSHFYRVPTGLTPRHEWYAPDRDEFRALDDETKVHCYMGGLLLRKIDSSM